MKCDAILDDNGDDTRSKLSVSGLEISHGGDQKRNLTQNSPVCSAVSER